MGWGLRVAAPQASRTLPAVRQGLGSRHPAGIVKRRIIQDYFGRCQKIGASAGGTAQELTRARAADTFATFSGTAMTDNSLRAGNRNRDGVVLLITGLPAAGKTTLGAALAAELTGRFGRAVTLLDGDEVRKLLSSELGYSREHRSLNVLRHGYIAAEIAKHGGIAVCSLIAHYASDRAEMRRRAVQWGSFIEVYLSTPLAECMRRDPKGLYARARTGELRHVTGIDDPYEPPARPELQLNGAQMTVAETVAAVVDFLLKSRLLSLG